jgi:uncharacterized membrane protein YfcA
LLILFSAYSLARPSIKPVTTGGALADAGVGFLNGILGSLTGFACILTTNWCSLRGWPREQQRAVFQPFGVAIFAMSALWLGASRTISADIIWLFLLGLPVLLLDTWAGLKLFGRLNEACLRKIVLILLFSSGVTLLF